MGRVADWMLNVGYLSLLVVVGPWLVCRKWWQGKPAAPLWPRFWGVAPARNADATHCLWFHAVSVGEVTALQTLLAEVRRRLPQAQIVLSTTTATGYQVARQRYPELEVCYSPLDFSWAVDRAMRTAQPDLLVLCELEIWPNWIRSAARFGIRLAVVNGRLSVKSYQGYQRWGLLKQIFAKMDLVACQTDLDAERFRAVGARATAVHVTGSMKFDGAETDRQNPKTRGLAKLAGIGTESVIFLAGSTSEPEESLALGAFGELAAEHPELRLVLVPRHPERFAEVAELIKSRGHAWCRRSDLRADEIPPAWRILLVDTLGELGGWWGTAQIGYVGGSMGPREGQNMIEPAAYGAAVCFGPRTKNFRDVVQQLLRAQAAVVVENQADLTDFLRQTLQDRTRRQQMGMRAQGVVVQNLGATDKTASRLVDLAQPAQGAGRLSPRPRAPYIKKLVRGRRVGPSRD